MASLNESLFNTPSAKRALKIHEARVNEAVKVRKARGLDTTMEQKMSTAICLENTRQRLRAFESFSYPAYNGATQPSNIGQYKRFALDMVATLVPNLIAPELVSVQAINLSVA